MLTHGKQTADTEELLPCLKHHAAIMRTRLARFCNMLPCHIGHNVHSGRETWKNDPIGRGRCPGERWSCKGTGIEKSKVDTLPSRAEDLTVPFLGDTMSSDVEVGVSPLTAFAMKTIASVLDMR